AWSRRPGTTRCRTRSSPCSSCSARPRSRRLRRSSSAMSAVARRRRTYVAPDRSPLRRLQAAAFLLPSPAPRVLLAAGVALGIILCAFGAQGGLQLVRTTWTEIGLLLTGAALFAWAVLAPGRPETPVRLRGVALLSAFAALAALTALSINWSRV